MTCVLLTSQTSFVWSTSDCLQTSWGHQVGFSLQQKIVMLFFLCVSFLLSFLPSLPSFFLFLSFSFLICLIQYNLQSKKLQGNELHMDWTSRKIFCYALWVHPTIINDCIQEKYSFYTLVKIYYIVTISHRLCSGFQLDVYTPVGC